MKKFDGTKPHPVEVEGFMLGDFYKVGQTIDLDWKQSREFRREGRVGEPGAVSGRAAKKGKS